MVAGASGSRADGDGLGVSKKLIDPLMGHGCWC